MPASHVEKLVAGKLLKQPMKVLGKERSVSSGKPSFQHLAEKDVYVLLESSNIGKERDFEQLLLVPCLKGDPGSGPRL